MLLALQTYEVQTQAYIHLYNLILRLHIRMASFRFQLNRKIQHNIKSNFIQWKYCLTYEYIDWTIDILDTSSLL